MLEYNRPTKEAAFAIVDRTLHSPEARKECWDEFEARSFSSMIVFLPEAGYRAIESTSVPRPQPKKKGNWQ